MKFFDDFQIGSIWLAYWSWSFQYLENGTKFLNGFLKYFSSTCLYQTIWALKIAANSSRVVVLTSKAGAHKFLLNSKNLDYKIEGKSSIYEIPVYCLTYRKMILTMPICRVYLVVYIHKISRWKTLLLKNYEIYNV